MLPKNLWQNLCSYDNLFLAYRKARKHKTTREYVIEFEKNLEHNLLVLRSELLLHCYKPKPLVDFVVRDPKTRKISKSDFRDRVVHHALCNIIEPIFEKGFIYDSYANRIGKGTLKAVERFDYFKRKVSKNNTLNCYILKADIRKYFENIDHKLLISIIKKRIADKKVIWLVRRILANYSGKERKGNKNVCSACFPSQTQKGMPLGNLTSQFFANVYLSELDHFVKHKLKVKYYIRYVDDFVLLGTNKERLKTYKEEIDVFLRVELNLQLHKEKSKIFQLGSSFSLLGFRGFYYHRLLKKPNIRKMRDALQTLKEKYYKKESSYDDLYNLLEGWIAYAKNANAYKIRKKTLADFENDFPKEISTKEINRILRTK